MRLLLKNIRIGALLFLLAFAGKVQGQTVSLNFAPNTNPTHQSGQTFQVVANYAYSMIPGGSIIISISYNNTILTFCGGPLFDVVPTPNINGATTTLTYNFPAVINADNRTGAIFMCFRSVCPTICLDTLESHIEGRIEADGTNPHTIASAINYDFHMDNRYNGYYQHSFHSYNATTSEITFKLNFQTDCYSVTNPVFEVLPPLGSCRLVSVINGTQIPNTNTFTPSNSPIVPTGPYVYYYTIRLPCDTPAGTIITSNVRLSGNNTTCVSPTGNFSVDYNPVSFTLPTSTHPYPEAELISSTTTGYNYFTVRVENTGNAPLNLHLENFLPNVQFTNIRGITNQSSPPLTNVSFENCDNVILTDVINYSLLPVSPNLTYAKKINIDIVNLLPGNSCSFDIRFNLGSACANMVETFRTDMNYTCNRLNNRCDSCDETRTAWDTARINLSPYMQCIQEANNNMMCLKTGDTASFCIRFRNEGNMDLVNGQLRFNLTSMPNMLTYVNNSINVILPNGAAAPTYSGGSFDFNLPTIPTYTSPNYFEYEFCFKAIVNPNVPFGSYTVNYIISNSTNPISFTQQMTCPQYFNICALPRAEIIKEVKGSLDASYGISGNGLQNSTAMYKVTINNTGNAKIQDIELIDRLPIVGDQYILTCMSRGSDFSVQYNTISTTPSTNVTYNATPNVNTGWNGVNNCNSSTPVNFTSTSSTPNIKIILSNPILPGNNFTFTFPVQIPSDAPLNGRACNTIGMIAKYADNANNTYNLNPIESSPSCLIVKEIIDSISNQDCCKKVTKSISSNSIIENNVLKINSNLSFGLSKMKKVSVSLIDFQVINANGCDTCEKNPMNMGNITNPSGGVSWTNLPTTSTSSRLIEWNDENGRDLSSGVPLSFDIPLPIHNPKATCCDTILYCLKFSFTDTNCITCDTIICYKAFNGENCKPIACECKGWARDKIKYTGGGEHGDIECNTSTTLNLRCATSYTFTCPAYNCNPNSQSCPVSFRWTVDGLPVGGTLGNPFITTFTTGNHSVMVTPYCGNKPCPPCKFLVKASCDTIDCCKGSNWGDRSYEVDGVTKQLPKCGKDLGELKCNITRNIKICYNCNPNCAANAQIRYTIFNSFNVIQSTVTVASCSNASITTPNITGSYSLLIEAICGGKVCDTCIYTFTTKCNDTGCKCGKWSNDTSQIMIHGFNLGGTDEIEQNVLNGNTYSSIYNGTSLDLTAIYNCIGDACNATYNWTIQPVTGPPVIYNTQTIPNFIFNQDGTYKVKLVVKCGGTTCDSSRIKIVVIKKAGCNCGDIKWNPNSTIQYVDYSSNLGQGKKIKCNEKSSTATVPVGSSMTYSAAPYLCTIGCTSTYNWKIIDLTNNSIVNYGINITLPFTYSAPILGKYKFIIYAICGTKICDSCAFNFNTKDKSCCPGWWISKNVSCNGETTQDLICGKNNYIKCNKTYTINANYTCDNESVCNGNSIYRMAATSGATLTGNGLFTATANGNYVITIEGKCGDSVCVKCIVTFVVENCSNCCPTICDSSFNRRFYNQTSWIGIASSIIEFDTDDDETPISEPNGDIPLTNWTRNGITFNSCRSYYNSRIYGGVNIPINIIIPSCRYNQVSFDLSVFNGGTNGYYIIKVHSCQCVYTYKIIGSGDVMFGITVPNFIDKIEVFHTTDRIGVDNFRIGNN